MNPFFAPVIENFWWLFLLFSLAALFKLFKPYLKGKFGEFAVIVHAKCYLKQPHYILMNDLTFEDGRGATTQIDHLLLSPFGLFVIETKNYKGWIFGGERQKCGLKNFINRVINSRIRCIRTINTSKCWNRF